MKDLLACSGATCCEVWMQTVMPGSDLLQLCWPLAPVLPCLMLTILVSNLASIAMTKRADQEGTSLGTKKVDPSRCARSQVGGSHSPTKTKLRWGSEAQRAVSGQMAGRQSPMAGNSSRLNTF